MFLQAMPHIKRHHLWRRVCVREYINLTIEFGKLINATAKSVTDGNLVKQRDGRQTVQQLHPKLGQGTSACDTSHCGSLLLHFK